MNKEQFENQVFEIAKKYGAKLNPAGSRYKYKIETLYGTLFLTTIDLDAVFMRWSEEFDQGTIERMFDKPPGPSGKWNIHGANKEQVLEELDLRLSVLIVKLEEVKKSA